MDLTLKLWKTRAFDYNQNILLIMLANARFQSIEKRQILGPNLPEILCAAAWVKFKVLGLTQLNISLFQPYEQYYNKIYFDH